MGGFTVRQSFELWKQKLRLFNPKTYDVLRYIWYWIRIQFLKIAIFFGHQPTRLKTSRLSSADKLAWKEPSRGVLDISETCFAKGLKDSPYSFGRDSRWTTS